MLAGTDIKILNLLAQKVFFCSNTICISINQQKDITVRGSGGKKKLTVALEDLAFDLPLIRDVSLDKALNFCEPQSSHL